MLAVLAAVPFVLALALLLARVPAPRAALMSLASAVAVTAIGFQTPIDQIARAEWRVAPTCVEVALILLGGVMLSELMSASGANQRFADWISGAGREPARAVVLVALAVTPFAESVTGFGVGVLVAVPLLRRLGLTPFRAAAVGLLGLVIVPWGALAPGTLVAADLTGVDTRDLGVWSALLSVPVFALVGAAALVTAVGTRRAVTALPELVTAVAALSAGVWAVNAIGAVPLAGALGSLVALAATLGLIAARERRWHRMGPDVWRALTPYLVLVGSLLLARAVTAAANVRGAPATVATSPALWLLVTCALTPTLAGLSAAAARRCLSTAAGRWLVPAETAVVFLVVGTLLTVTGMSQALADAATSLGTGYLVLAPFVGGLGGFVTGSNTAANAMFATSQATAAAGLGVSTTTVVAVQNVSASLATMVSVPRVALATGLVGPVTAVGDGDRARVAPTEDDARPSQVTRHVGAVVLGVLVVLAVITVLVA